MSSVLSLWAIMVMNNDCAVFGRASPKGLKQLVYVYVHESSSLKRWPFLTFHRRVITHDHSVQEMRPLLVSLGVVQFSVRVSQSFRWKDLGGWVGRKNLSERIVGSRKPVHLKNVKEYVASIIGLYKNNGAVSYVGIHFPLIRSLYHARTQLIFVRFTRNKNQ